jgi:DNA repair protein RadC
METLYVLEKLPIPNAEGKRLKRPLDVRERMLRDGPRSLADRELLAAMIGSGSVGKSVAALAQDVLAVLDTDKNELDIGILTRLSGMGDAKACSIAAALELGRRFHSMREKRVTMPRDLFPLISHFADRKQEHFLCVSLNGAHEVIAARGITAGLINKTPIHPREVFADPITDRACAIIVAHNHPSGNLEPSKEDIDITKRLKAAGDLLGIPLLDHLVFSSSEYYSFVEHGQLSPYIGE